MYSTIQEAWNNDITDVYAENFKQNKFKTISSSNNFFNIHEDYGSIKGVRTSNTSTPPPQVKTKKKKKKKIVPSTQSSQSSTVQSTTTVNPKIRSIKSKIKCKDILKHIKKCKKCRKKIEKYINKNKIVIDMNPVEVRKMLLCLILIGMFIMLFNMITERRMQKQ